MDKKSSEYKGIKVANICFLFCILFEVVGVMTIIFFGTLGAQMAIYFMTFLFVIFIARKHKDDMRIPFVKPKGKELLQTIGITIGGIPIAMLLNALAGFISSAGLDTTEDVIIYPIWLSIITFAVVPAIVEEYVFRGIILTEYLKVGTAPAVLVSSIFFAMLHFSLGSVMYGFFFGLVFALVRIATGNMIYSMMMHFVFNAINVVMSYFGPAGVAIWLVITVMTVLITLFIVLSVIFFKNHPVELTKGKYKKRQLFTKEGYVTMAVCFIVTGMLLMM